MPLPAVSRLFRSALRTPLLPVANITSKPAQTRTSVGEQAIGLIVMFVTILGPSSWILAHLEDYKKKE